MKNRNIVLLFIVLSLTSFSQKDTLVLRKISWGLSFSPDLCYRTLDYGGSAQWIADSRDKSEMPKLGFTFGINMSRLIGKRISLDAGFLFSDKGHKTKWNNLGWDGINKEYPTESRVVFHYQYLDIPIRLNYYITKRKVAFFVSAGISSNIFVRQRTVLYLKYPDGDQTKTKSIEPGIYSRVNFAVLVSAGVQLSLAKRLCLRVEPVFRRSLTPVLINVKDKEYSYSVGLNLGIFLRMKKR